MSTGGGGGDNAPGPWLNRDSSASRSFKKNSLTQNKPKGSILRKPRGSQNGLFKRNSASLTSFRRRGTVCSISQEAHSFSSLLEEREIKAAFDFFDVDNTGRISFKDLQERIRVFHPNKQSLPKGELKFLMGGKQYLELDDLMQIIEDGDTIAGFDPMEEAFKLYDPENTGFIDMEVLSKVFGDLGHGEITNEDVNLLVEIADYDSDGKIGLVDFRNMTKLLDPSNNTL